MRAIGIREFKNKLSENLRYVRQGETVLITDHDLVIAQVIPPPAYLNMPFETELEALHRLAQTGVVCLAQETLNVAAIADLPKPVGVIDLAGALDSVKGERW